MQSFEKLTRQYSLSKTLRFALRPQGKTLDFVKKEGVLVEDKRRADEYKTLKKWIDEYHREIIDSVLQNFSFGRDDLKSLENMETRIRKLQEQRGKQKGTPDESSQEREKLLIKKEQEALKKKLRKQISDAFKKDERFENLFKKELVHGKKGLDSDLGKWAKKKLRNEPENKEISRLIEHTLPYFYKFNGYLKGFHENRKNMYKAEDKASAISHRVVDVNWLKFHLNQQRWKAGLETIKENLGGIEASFASELKTLGAADIPAVFRTDTFNQCLNQRGIESYNTILGGYFDENQEEKVKGLNEYFNLAYQKGGKQGTSIKLIPLNKQILAHAESRSFALDSFVDDKEMLSDVEEFYKKVLMRPNGNNETLLSRIANFMKEFPEEGLENIYLKNDIGLRSFSGRVFDGDWAFLRRIYQDAIDKKVAELKANKARRKEIDQEEKKGKTTHYSVAELENALFLWKAGQERTNENKARLDKISEHCLVDYFRRFSFRKGFLDERIKAAYKKCSSLIEEAGKETTKENFLRQNKKKISALKELMESVRNLVYFMKPLLLKKDKKWNSPLLVDMEFYSELESLYFELSPAMHLYNKVRNHVTKKLYSEEKYRLNFDNGELLDGWDKNKEPDNFGLILQKGDAYYLGLIHPKHKKIWGKLPAVEPGEPCYRKMVYKLVPGPEKMLPKVFLISETGKAFYKPSQKILDNYNRKTHTKSIDGDEFNLKHCHELIDFFKASLKKHPEWNVFNFRFSPTRNYQDLSGFYREFKKQSYRVDFVDVPERCIDEWVQQGKFYLFQIYSKDFSSKTKGIPNLNTLYWRSVFSPENLNHRDESGFVHPLFKLSGEAELFYRERSLRTGRVEHPKGREVVNKLHNAGKKKTLDYDVIKDRRYKHDQFFFHVPIALNYAVDGKPSLNNQVRELLANDSGINIVGIDRGERNLACCTVIDQRGKILHSRSFNEIKTFFDEPVNYHNLLHSVAEKRKNARNDWLKIDQIKDLKNGYISQLVHEICQMMRKWNAIVVLEDLNFGFKRGRFAIEKQVYQNLEKALIQKLNYLVFKDLRETPFEPGSTLNGFQLASKFESFEKLGKQTGVLFYVPAQYTSKIDPTTGFCNLFSSSDLRYASVEKSKSFLKQFDQIVFDEEERCLRFDFNYKKIDKARSKIDRPWQVFAKGERLIYKIFEKRMNPVVLEEICNTFLQKHIPGYESGENLQNAIADINEKDFFHALLFVLRAALQIRNFSRERGVDYIISPVKNSTDRFFDSREAQDGEPQDADANGAYHIALKGLQYVKRMKETDDSDIINLAIGNDDWFEFVQNKSCQT